MLVTDFWRLLAEADRVGGIAEVRTYGAPRCPECEENDDGFEECEDSP